MKLPRNGAPLLVLQMHEAAAQPGQFLLRAFDLGNVFMRDDDPARLRLVRPGHPELEPARPLRAAAGILHPELGAVACHDVPQRLRGSRRILRHGGGRLADSQVIHPDAVVLVGIAGGVGKGAPSLVDRDDRPGFVEHRDMGRQGIQGGAQQGLRLHVGRDQGRQAVSLRRPCGRATPFAGSWMLHG